MPDSGAGATGRSRGHSRYAAVRDSPMASAAHDVAAMAYWRLFARRRGDVFLCSYPKCGRTWLRFLLTDYQLRLFGVDDFELTLANFPALSPNVTLFTGYRLRQPPVCGSIHRILGTHSECPWLFRGLPIIVLRRDLRDALVSFYYRRVAFGEFDGDLEAFLWSPWGIRHAVRYHNLWCRALERFPEGMVLELEYERLHADPAECVRECLAFMNLEVRESLVAKAVAYAEADNMRRLEAQGGSPDFTAGQLRGDARAFQVREARVGGHRRELTDEAVARMGETLRETLVDDCGYDY